MLHPQILIRQAHQDRPRLSRKRNPRSNAGRRLAAQRPSLEAELTYRKALREVSALWAGRVVAAIGPLLSASVPAPAVDARTDAKETPLEKIIRTSSRGANDGIGTTAIGGGRELTSIEKVNQIGVENAKFARSGMRPESLEFLRAAQGRRAPIDVAVHANGDVVLTDGRHRLTVAKEEGATEIAAMVRTYDDELNTVSLESATLSISPRSPEILAARAEVGAALGALKAEAKGFGAKQGRLINTIAAKVDKHNAAEFERVVGIDVRSLGTSVTDALDAFRAENVDLIQSIPDEMLEQVGEVLEKAWTSGERVETLSDLLQKRFGVSESKGDLIARDQTLKLNGQLARERQQAAGITKYVWSTSSDERVRGNPDGKYPNPSKTGRVVSDHYHLNGKTFTYGEPPITNEATGDRNEPGQDFSCRCVAAPVLDFLDDAGDSGDGGEE